MPATIFQRAETLWLVFDTRIAIDITMLTNDTSRTIREASVALEDDAQVVRLKLERPRLISVDADDSGWSVSVGDAMLGASKPLAIARNIVGPGRTSVTIPFDDPRRVHWLSDPEAGDKLLVVTGLGPARGLVRTRTSSNSGRWRARKALRFSRLPTISRPSCRPTRCCWRDPAA